VVFAGTQILKAGENPEERGIDSKERGDPHPRKLPRRKPGRGNTVVGMGKGGIHF